MLHSQYCQQLCLFIVDVAANSVSELSDFSLMYERASLMEGEELGLSQRRLNERFHIAVGAISNVFKRKSAEKINTSYWELRRN